MRRRSGLFGSQNDYVQVWADPSGAGKMLSKSFGDWGRATPQEAESRGWRRPQPEPRASIRKLARSLSTEEFLCLTGRRFRCPPWGKPSIKAWNSESDLDAFLANQICFLLDETPNSDSRVAIMIWKIKSQSKMLLAHKALARTIYRCDAICMYLAWETDHVFVSLVKIGHFHQLHFFKSRQHKVNPWLMSGQCSCSSFRDHVVIFFYNTTVCLQHQNWRFFFPLHNTFDIRHGTSRCKTWKVFSFSNKLPRCHRWPHRHHG